MEWYNDKYTLSLDSYDVLNWNYIVGVLADEPCAEIWESKKINSYRYNTSLKTGSSSIYLGYWHNAQLSSNMGLHSLKIEFNFNKVKGDKLFDWVCDVILYPNLRYLNVKRVDMCTDITAPITNFVVDKCRKKNARSYNSTLYFGDRGRNGAVKIYDKGAELGTDDILTRYEVTIQPDGFKLLDKVVKAKYSLVEAIVLDDWQVGLDLDPMLKAAVICVMNGDMSINEFGRYQKKKIKDFMCEMKSFKIGNDSVVDINNAVVSCCSDLVSYVHSVHDSITFGNYNELPF